MKRTFQAAGGVQDIACMGASTSAWARTLVKLEVSLVERQARSGAQIPSTQINYRSSPVVNATIALQSGIEAILNLGDTRQGADFILQA